MVEKKIGPSTLWAWVSASILFGSAGLLISGSTWLQLAAIESIGLPIGTLVAWGGIVAFPTALYFGPARRLGRSGLLAKSCMFLLKAALLLASSWGLVAYGLAGNWAFTFSGRALTFRGSDEASVVFWAYSAGVVFVTVLALLLLLACRLVGGGDSQVSS